MKKIYKLLICVLVLTMFTGCSQATSKRNSKEIIEDMRNDELSNPFTGEELSEEEFGRQVITYFSVSPEFMRLSNA